MPNTNNNTNNNPRNNLRDNQKEDEPQKTLKPAYFRGFFNPDKIRLAKKLIQYKHYHGINIPGQSKRNVQALIQRLRAGTHLPEEEKASYQQETTHRGCAKLTRREADFFKFWLTRIVPLFTAKHGTQSLSRIQKSGALEPVADRKRQNAYHHNSRTGGHARQEFIYFVLGINGCDEIDHYRQDHPLPYSVAEHAAVIKLFFDRMSTEERRQFQGTFIGGHSQDYLASRHYPTVMFGNTQVDVAFEQGCKTTTFTRQDGTIITENLTFEQEIIAAWPSLDTIFEWLGYKLIEYLRFIGGSFQCQVLRSQSINEITSVFHSLFPSHRFPELKVPLKRIPINAPYVSVSETEADTQEHILELHNACKKLDAPKILALSPLIDMKNVRFSGQTPLHVVLKQYNAKNSQQYRETVKTLLSLGSLGWNVLADAWKCKDGALLKLLLAGAQEYPEYEHIRVLPEIELNFMQAIIKSDSLLDFKEFYPKFRQYNTANELLLFACNNVKENKDSIAMFQHLVHDADSDYCEPNEKKTYLMTAVLNNNITAVRCLLQRTDLNIDHTITSHTGAISPYEGWSALHFSVWRGHVDISILLLAHGADSDKKDYWERTPLVIVQQVLSQELAPTTQQEQDSRDFQHQGMLAACLISPSRSKIQPTQKSHDILLEELTSLGRDTKEAPLDYRKPDKPTHCSDASAACVTIHVQEKLYILFVRKGDKFGAPKQHYLFPGGLRNTTDKTPQETAIRETQEETGLTLTGAKICEFFSSEQRLDTLNIKRAFFHVDLGEHQRLPRCFPNSDVAETRWIAWENLEKGQTDNIRTLSFEAIPVCYDNAQILYSIVQGNKIDQTALKNHQRMTYDRNLWSTIIFGFFSSMAGSEEEWKQYATITFQKYLLCKNNLEDYPIISKKLAEFMVAIQDAARRNEARLKMQTIITNLTDSGCIHIDRISSELSQLFLPVFFLACSQNNIDSIRWLAGRGAAINAAYQCSGGRYMTPLMLLFSLSYFECASMLINDFGADVAFSSRGSSVLIAASGNRNIPLPVLENLVEKMDVLDPINVGSALLAAISVHRHDIVEYLLSCTPLNLNRPYPMMTQLGLDKAYFITHAVNTDNLIAVKLLLKHGAETTFVRAQMDKILLLLQYQITSLQNSLQYSLQLRELFEGEDCAERQAAQLEKLQNKRDEIQNTLGLFKSKEDNDSTPVLDSSSHFSP